MLKTEETKVLRDQFTAIFAVDLKVVGNQEYAYKA